MAHSVHKHFRLARKGDEAANPIELILDVVFVLAFSECTAYVAHGQGWLSVIDAVFILALLWRGWTGFAWYTSALNPQSVVVRLAIFTAMGAFGVMALSIPDAFDHGAFWYAGSPVMYEFISAYVVIRLVHFTLGLLASRGEKLLRTSVVYASIAGVIAVVLLYSGAAVEGGLGYVLWALAIIADFAIVVIVSRFGLRQGVRPYRPSLAAPGHFAERHGLIVIIALGETIMSTQNARLNGSTVLLVLTSVALLASVWGVYFDGTDDAARNALMHAPAGLEQNTLARRGYSLLHFPLLVGTVLLALGPHAALVRPTEPFETHICGAFFGGLALFLLSHVAFVYIMTRRVNGLRLVVALLMVGLIAFGNVRPAWESLVLATSIMCLMVSGQRWWEARSRA